MQKSAKRRTPEQLREHYEIEKELAGRLRRASKAQRAKLYRQVYDERAQRISHHPLVVRAADPKARQQAALPQVRLLKPFVSPQTHFLEIGVGDGAVSLEMAKYVHRVYALDVSDELLAHLSPPPNFEFRLFEGLELPLLDNSIDVAYSNDVLEHLHPEDACDQLTSLLRVLRQGGKYICITPNRLSGPHDISSHFDEVATGFHLKEYAVGELCALFRRVGFSRIQTFLTVKGYCLMPPTTPLPFETFEGMITRLPLSYRRRIAGGLAAVKVVATK